MQFRVEILEVFLNKFLAQDLLASYLLILFHFTCLKWINMIVIGTTIIGPIGKFLEEYTTESTIGRRLATWTIF